MFTLADVICATRTATLQQTQSPGAEGDTENDDDGLNGATKGPGQAMAVPRASAEASAAADERQGMEIMRNEIKELGAAVAALRVELDRVRAAPLPVTIPLFLGQRVIRADEAFHMDSHLDLGTYQFAEDFWRAFMGSGTIAKHHKEHATRGRFVVRVGFPVHLPHDTILTLSLLGYNYQTTPAVLCKMTTDTVTKHFRGLVNVVFPWLPATHLCGPVLCFMLQWSSAPRVTADLLVRSVTLQVAFD